MSPDTKIQTGNEGLDQDLKKLFDLQEAGQLESILAKVQDGILSLDEFRQIVPDSLVRIGFAFSHTPRYEALKDRVPVQAHRFLERAKEIVDNQLGPLIASPLAIQCFRALAPKDERADTVGLGKEFRRIAGIQNVELWLGQAPRLVPAVRLALLSRDSELLLDSTLDWDDLFFVIDGLLRVVVEALDSGRGLLEAGQLDFGEADRQKLFERLKSIEESFSKLHEIAPTYGIHQATSGSKPDEGEEPAKKAGQGTI